MILICIQFCHSVSCSKPLHKGTLLSNLSAFFFINHQMTPHYVV